MTNSDTQITRERGECYNPRCSEPAGWPKGVHESYCSWECAVEARSGRADRLQQSESDRP